MDGVLENTMPLAANRCRGWGKINFKRQKYKIHRTVDHTNGLRHQVVGWAVAHLVHRAMLPMISCLTYMCEKITLRMQREKNAKV